MTYIIYAAPDFETLAHELVKDNPDQFRYYPINWGHFPDGTPNLFIHGIEQVSNANVLFLANFADAQQKLDQLSVMMVLCESFINSLTVVLPFLPTATMERVTQEGVVATANVDAWLFNSLPSTTKPIKLIIYDLHTLQNRFYFKGNCLVKMASAIPLFKKEIIKHHDNIVIVFPDDGAAKRFGPMLAEYPNVICGKVRVNNERIIHIKEGEEYIKGNNVFIVDDLVQSGGTLINCAELLHTFNPLTVNAFVTHTVFPNDSYEKLFESELFTTFYHTNSVPHVAEKIYIYADDVCLNIKDNLLNYL